MKKCQSVLAASLCLVALAGCGGLDLDPPAGVIHARFDPDEGVIPLPSDVVRDDKAGHLDLDTERASLTATEREVYGYLNTLDGWSTTQSGKVEFSGAIDPASVTEDTVQVWRVDGPVPARISDATVGFEDENTRVTFTAPRAGWATGGKYMFVVRGGDDGVRGRAGEPVEADAAFYFLRLTTKLDDAEYQRAFPGETVAERLENAGKLEDIRQDLAPYFDFIEGSGIPRTDVAALWTFTVTDRTELAMDQGSQRVPIPWNLLFDYDKGRVSLDDADWDKPIERDAKHKLRSYDGFARSAELLFQFTAPVDPSTVNSKTVVLYELADDAKGGKPVIVPAKVEAYDDNVQVAIIPDTLPLKASTTYGVIVREGILDATGRAVTPMTLGYLMRATTPVADKDGKSQSSSISDENAVKIERVRTQLAPLLDAVGRRDILTAWSFTTMSAEEHLVERVRLSDTLGLDPNPTILKEQNALEAVLDFPLGFGALLNVGRVITGTIQSPVYLDPLTHAFREDGSYEVENVTFMMTLPRNVGKKPVPVVVFGHGIMTERRFVLAVADGLAARGFAAVSIDLPYHGTRTICVDTSPIAVVNPSTGEAANFPPCESGAMCSPDGQCVHPDGSDGFAIWPGVNMPVASGAAFLQIEQLPSIKDHFEQSYIDLGSLVTSIEKGDWNAAIGVPLQGDKLYWVGQSLGGIIGASFVALVPEFHKAVLNVPGADLVDLFDQSTFFHPQINGYFTKEGIVRSAYEGRRFLNIARWLMDPVDPQSLAHLYRDRPAGTAFIQMAINDFIVPNSSTDTLVNISGLPRYDYIGTHMFMAIPEPANFRGIRDMGDFLTGKLEP